MIRTLLWLFGGVLLGGLIHLIVILMLPIPYYQDLVPGRPGTAAALLALQKLVVDCLTAGVFAFGSALGGFETVAAIGTAVGLTGALCLHLADRHNWFALRA